MMLKLKFMQNLAILEVINSGLKTDIQSGRNDRNSRFKINGLLSDKTGYITAKSM